jgi:HAE1 family hydrophobic/amphiphilic exporter-1
VVVGQLFAKNNTKRRSPYSLHLLVYKGFVADGFELKVQDKGDDDWANVSKVTNEFVRVNETS